MADVFSIIARHEIKNRNLSISQEEVLQDILQTSLCLSTRGMSGQGNYAALQDGVSRLKAFIFSEKYQIEKAIVHASMAAYCAGLIQTGQHDFDRFADADRIVSLEIRQPMETRLNKLRKTNPEAFFYWYNVLKLPGIESLLG